MFGQLLRKEFLLIGNTPMLFWMNTLYPIFILCVLPFATNMDINSIQTIVIDQDCSAASQELCQKFFQSGYFLSVKDDEAGGTISYQEAFELVKKGKVDVIVTLPKGFEQALYSGEKADMSVVVNSINASKGAAAQAYSQLIVGEYQKELVEKMDPRRTKDPIEFCQKTLFNSNRNYKYFVIPGMIGILVTLISIIMPAVGVVQEKEFGTIEQLNVTPVKPTLILLSKALPYWIIIVLLMPILVLMTGVLYGLWPQGSFLAIEVISLLNAISFTGLGLIVANFSSRLQQLMFMVIFLMINVLLLGGVFTPVSGMPVWAQFIAKLLPNYYYTRDLRSIYLRGSALCDVTQGMLYMMLFSIVMLLLSRLTYHKRG